VGADQWLGASKEKTPANLPTPIQLVQAN